MKLTEENVAMTAYDLENWIFYYDYHGKLPILNDADIKTLRDAVEFLRALRFYAD